eukprot:gene8628-9508_t
MEILQTSTQMEYRGEHVCHLEIGQPGHSAPRAVLEAAHRALDENRIGYSSAVGILEIRRAISDHYKAKYNLDIDPERVVICTGSSACLVLLCLACFELGDHVAICSCGYPCYRNILKAMSLHYFSICVNENFKLTSAILEEAIEQRRVMGLPPIKGLILSSPANPTGAMLSPVELQEIGQVCCRHGIIFICDEVYHGISYGEVPEASALQFLSDAIVINSFSKFYSMTGWRLGWMVVPLSLRDTLLKLSESLYIAPPTLSQLAAVAAFDCIDELKVHVHAYALNRRTVLEVLDGLGLRDCAAPSEGAFFIYLDLKSKGVNDSVRLCARLLDEAKVAITPGVDFEDPSTSLGQHRIRISFSRCWEEVHEGMMRFKHWWIKNTVDELINI